MDTKRREGERRHNTIQINQTDVYSNIHYTREVM